MLSNKQLLISTRQFARENRRTSWWHLCTTLAAILLLISITASELMWPLRILASGLLGLTIVRAFVLYHDFQHGAFLRRSRAASCIMQAIGFILLTPPSGWNRSHNHHHTHNSKLSSPDIGSYPLMTVGEFRAAIRTRRAVYVAQRHPLTMCLGYLTVFLWGMCLQPFFANPRRHWDGAVSFGGHLAMVVCLGWHDLEVLALTVLIPFSVASALGAYLFYVQHNFPGAQLTTAPNWNYTTAALDSSSFLQMGCLMNWFTANIGFHHVHHLNPRIPFYRLPEAMRALPALQTPGTTSLSVADVRACLGLKLWDPVSRQLVTWRGLREAA